MTVRESVRGMRVVASSASDGPVPSATVAEAAGVTRAVVLVLHGGEEISTRAATPNGRAALRMLPFAWDIGRQVRERGVAVWRLHYRYRGWNGVQASPVTDARWALDDIRRRHGEVPVVLLGHSMGGRVAVNVADTAVVRDLVLLAPWLPPGEPVDKVQDSRVLLVHGDRDRVTRLSDSEAWAARAARTGAAVDLQRIQGGEHTMLRRAPTWQRRAAQGVSDGLTRCGVLPG